MQDNPDLAELTARLERFVATSDPAIMLDDRTGTLAFQLFPSAHEDLQVAHVLGWTYWYRGMVGSADQAASDLLLAFDLFSRVYEVDPSLVPEELRREFAGESAIDQLSREDLGQYGRAKLAEARRTGDPAALGDAIQAFRQALDDAPDDHPELASWLSNLSIALQGRHRATGHPQDLEEAIAVARDAVALTEDGHVDQAFRVNALATAYQLRLYQHDSLEDLNAFIDLARRVVELTQPGNRDRGGYLSNLGVALLTRHERTHELVDLDEALAVGQEAADAYSGGERFQLLSNLSLMWLRRFEATGDPASLDRALQLGQEAVQIRREDDPQRFGVLYNLALVLRVRYENTGDATELEVGISIAREIERGLPDGHPLKAVVLEYLAAALGRRLDLSSSASDLDEAVAVADAAVQHSAGSPTGRPGRRNALAAALLNRHQHRGAPADLDRAVAVARQAVAEIAADDPNRAIVMGTLAGALQRRFDIGGTMDDLDDSINALRSALETVADGRFDRAEYLSSLAAVLGLRYTITRNMLDLAEAAGLAQRAVDATPAGHPNRAMRLSNLAVLLQRQYDRFGEPAAADLDTAVDALQESVRATSEGHAQRAMHLSNLAIALATRDRLTNADLDAAVEAADAAVRAAPLDHIDRATFLCSLGNVLNDRHRRDHAAEDLARALDSYRTAMEIPTAPTSSRVQAAMDYARLAADSRNWTEAADGYRVAVDALPLLAGRHQVRADQQRALAAVTGVGCDAAAVAIQQGDPVGALRALEQGRGVLIGRSLDLRGEVGALRENDPALAARFEELRDALDSPTGAEKETGLTGDARYRLADELDGVIAQIRARPGMADFLAPPTLTTMTTVGPVIAVNVSRHRCDALILTSAGDVEVCPLPDLRLNDTAARADQLIDATRPDGSGSAADLREVLKWLWDVVAEPVLSHLDIHAAGSGALPRLWWLPTGPLTVLPLHAAGMYDSAGRHYGVPDLAASSTVSTLRALGATQARLADSGPATALAIAVPEADGARPLLTAEAEATMVAATLPGPTTTLIGPQATRNAVLAALPHASIAHFACHAMSEFTNPSASGLALSDGLLSVLDLSAVRVTGAHMAYLSACETASGGLLLDEAIHLSSAFQLAGYRHVIGTLWPIADDLAEQVARSIYADLATHPDAVAAAVHRATIGIRERYPRNPHTWAAHLHLGP